MRTEVKLPRDVSHGFLSSLQKTLQEGSRGFAVQPESKSAFPKYM
jgi:hypothetical protein